MRINRLSSEVLKLLSQKGKTEKVNAKGSSPKREVDLQSFKEISVEITKELKDFEPPRVSREKVEEIKRALKEGRYTVNPHRISEAIVREILGD